MIKRTLQELCLNITDGKHGDCENEENSGYYFISCKDIFDGQINYKNARQITKADFEETHKRTMLEVDDILLTNSGTIGRMAFVTDREATTKTTFQKSVAIIKPDKQKVLPRYLYYQLQNCVPQFINSSNGSAQKNLLLSTMRTFQIEIEENREKQEKIANTLSAYDDLIENNQKQIKLLEEAAQRLYKEWFVDLRFPGHENTKIVDGVTEGLSKSTVGNICKLRKVVITPDKIESNTPYIGLEHMPRNDICLSTWGKSEEINSNKFIYLKKDVLFGKIRPYFHKVGFALNDGITSTDTMVMVADQNLWGLLLVTVSSDTFVDFSYQNCKEGAKMPRADWKQMEKYAIMIADQATQKLFEQEILVITNKISALAFQCRSLREARDRMLPKLMGGEVEV